MKLNLLFHTRSRGHCATTYIPRCRYEFITQCWAESPDKRPSFQDLSQQLNSLLEGVAGYMDFSAFSGDSACGTEVDDHLEKKPVMNGYKLLETKNRDPAAEEN